MSTLVQTIQGLLTPQLFSSLAARTGLSESKVGTAMGASTGAIMDGLVGKARDPDVMSNVTRLIDQTPDSDDVSHVFDDESPIYRSGSKMLGLATHDLPGMIKRLGSSLGLGSGLVSSLLGAAAGIVMTALRKFSRARGGLDPTTLASSLLEERSSLHSIPHLGAETPARVSTAHETRPVARKRGKDLWWLVALVPLAILALWLFGRPRDKEEVVAVDVPKLTTPRTETPYVAPPEVAHETVPPATEPPVTEPPVTAAPEPMPAPEPETTPPEPPVAANETPPAEPPAPTEESAATDEPVATPEPAPETAQLGLEPGSPEATLMMQTTRSVGKVGDEWVVLDQVKFKTGSAVVPGEAKTQIINVAEVLKAKPDAKIEVGGFTSKPGSEELNRRLSEQRAEAVRTALIDEGVDPDQIEANGYGEDDPVQDTTDEVQENRRVAARIVTISTGTDEG